MPESAELLPGVRALDHTADVGIEVAAGSLPQLFHRAAAGMLALLREQEDATGAAQWLAASETGAAAPPDPDAVIVPAEHALRLEADDLPMLLVLWLRELLYLHEVHRFRYHAADFARLDERALQARLHGVATAAGAVGELKAVTYHGLQARPDGASGWYARVIFDV